MDATWETQAGDTYFTCASGLLPTGKAVCRLPRNLLTRGQAQSPSAPGRPCSRVCWGHKKVRVWGGRLRVLDLGVGEATKKREGGSLVPVGEWN